MRLPVTRDEWLHSAHLVRLVRRVCLQGRLRTAEFDDVEQDVRIAIWQSHLDDVVSSAWVVTVAHRKAVDMLRRRTRWGAHDQTLGDLLPDGHASPELRLILDADVQSFPARDRELFELRYHFGLTERETAKHMKTCRASVRWLERKCRERLGEEI